MCDNTFKTALREQGLSSFTKVVKPALSKKNIKERFWFVQMYKDWTVSDWEQVVFSDETQNKPFQLGWEDLVLDRRERKHH